MEPITVEHPDDPRIREFVGVRDADLRGRRGDGDGLFIAEGDLVLERALRAGYELRAVLVDATRTRPLPDAIPGGVPIHAASPEVVFAVTGMPRHAGCLASFRRRPVPPPDEVLAAAGRVVVLENLTNPTNLGVIARSALALGADALLLDPTSCDPLYRRASRVSMGEVFALPWSRLPAFPDGLDVVADAGFHLVALTPDVDAEPIDDVRFRPDDRVALVLGAEGPGLRPDTLRRIDRPVRIPMHGEADSLNVAAAAAVACFVLGRDRTAAATTDRSPTADRIERTATDRSRS